MNKLLKLTLLSLIVFVGQSNAAQNTNSILSNYEADPISSYAPNLQTMMNKDSVIKDNVDMMSKAEKYLDYVETSVNSQTDVAFQYCYSPTYTREKKIELLKNISSNLNSLKEEMTSVCDNVINTCDPRKTMYNGQFLYIEGKGFMSENYLSYTNKYNDIITLSVKCKEIIGIVLKHLNKAINLFIKYMPLENTVNQPQAKSLENTDNQPQVKRLEDYVDEID